MDIESVLRLGNGEDARDAGEHFFEAGNFLLEMTESRGSHAVDASGTALGRGASFGVQPAFAQHALQRRIERAFFNFEKIVGDLLDMFDEGVAMHGAKAK